MTQKEAVLQALKELGGKACNQDIIKRAIKYADFSGSKDPAATIRNYLNTDKNRILPVKGNRGWWQLSSYQEEVAQLTRENKNLQKQIEYYLSDKYKTQIISEYIGSYMEATSNKAQAKREDIHDVLSDIPSVLKFHYTEEVQDLLNHFNDEKLDPFSSISIRTQKVTLDKGSTLNGDILSDNATKIVTK